MSPQRTRSGEPGEAAERERAGVGPREHQRRGAMARVLTAAEVASFTGGKLESGQGGTPVRSVSIDSRAVEPGALFFAIAGRRHDGHRFVREALERGAMGVVIAQAVEIDRPVVKIRVADTTTALQELARAVRSRSAIKVVAITGSTGKTTTKEAAAAAAAARFKVLKSEGNLNNLYGLPLSLLKLDDEEVAVLEMGMSAPGEIARLTEIARPDVAVLTNVAEVHREFFPSLEAIGAAKGELFAGLGRGAVAVVNADDPLALAQALRFSGRRLSFGRGDAAEVRAEAIERRRESLRFTASYGREQALVRSRLLGLHNVYNLLAALAAARALEIPLAESAERLSDLSPAPHRGERLRFREGFLIIDETYNSNPSALAAALDLLREEEKAARRIAVLGDMLELGERAEALHRECGERAAASGLSVLIGVGPLGAFLLEGASRAGMLGPALLTAATAEEAGELVARIVRAGDVVLLKASRGLELEKALPVLTSRFSLDRS